MSTKGEWFWSGPILMENRGDHSDAILSVGKLPSIERAAIIAAAPSLLEFAELVEYYGQLREEKSNGRCITPGQWEMIRAAAGLVIAKAKETAAGEHAHG